MKLFNKIRQGSLAVSAFLASSLSMAASSAICVSGTDASGGSNCTISGLQGQISKQLYSGAQIFYAGAAIIGIALVIVGLLKLKAHSMDTQGTSGHLRSAIWLLIIGALMIAVPVVMVLAANSITGSNNVQLPSEAGIFGSSPAPKS
jgi:hypothetical protein